METYTTNFWDCSFPYGSSRQSNVANSDNLYTLSDLSASLFTQEETIYTIQNGAPLKTNNSLFLNNSYKNSNFSGSGDGICCSGKLQDKGKDVKLLSGAIAKDLIIGYSYHINLFHSSDISINKELDDTYFGYCAVPPKNTVLPSKGDISDTLINGIKYGDILKLESTINKKCPPIYLMVFDSCGSCLEGNYRRDLDVAIPVADNEGVYTCLKKTVNENKCNPTGCDENCYKIPNKESFCWAYDNSWSLNNIEYPTFEDLWNSNGGQSLSLGDKCEYYPKLMQIGCKNWSTLQKGYFYDKTDYGLGQQSPQNTNPTKAWTYEIFKSGTKEFSEIFYNYYFISFDKYYGKTYTNLKAEKKGDYYTGRITSDINFYNPSLNKLNTDNNAHIKSIQIKGGFIQIKYNKLKPPAPPTPPTKISKGCKVNC